MEEKYALTFSRRNTIISKYHNWWAALLRYLPEKSYLQGGLISYFLSWLRMQFRNSCKSTFAMTWRYPMKLSSRVLRLQPEQGYTVQYWHWPRTYKKALRWWNSSRIGRTSCSSGSFWTFFAVFSWNLKSRRRTITCRLLTTSCWTSAETTLK